MIRPRCSPVFLVSSEINLYFIIIPKVIQAKTNRLRGLVVNDLSSTLQPLSHSRKVTNSIFYRYFYGISSNEVHSLVPPFRPLEIGPALLFPHSRNTLIPTRDIFLKTTILWTKLLRGCSPHFTSQGSIVIFPLHPRNLHFLTSSLPFLLHNSFRINILLTLSASRGLY